MRATYPGISEAEIRWRDWNWIERRVDKIMRDKREARRFQLQGLLYSSAAAFAGGEAQEAWNRLLNALYSPDELAEMVRLQEEEAERQDEAERQKKLAAYIANLERTGQVRMSLR